MVLTRDELLKQAAATLSALKKRCAGDAASDPLAAKIQQLQRREKECLPLYSKEILADATKVHGDLAPARKAANQVLKHE